MKGYIEKQLGKIGEIKDRTRQSLIGIKVKIISKYNGQMYGSSKKPMTGRIGKIDSVCMDNGECHVWLEDLVYGYPGLHIDEIEFI